LKWSFGEERGADPFGASTPGPVNDERVVRGGVIGVRERGNDRVVPRRGDAEPGTDRVPFAHLASRCPPIALEIEHRALDWRQRHCTFSTTRQCRDEAREASTLPGSASQTGSVTLRVGHAAPARATELASEKAPSRDRRSRTRGARQLRTRWHRLSCLIRPIEPAKRSSATSNAFRNAGAARRRRPRWRRAGARMPAGA